MLKHKFALLKAKPKLSVWQYLSLGYLVVILLGSALLSLPFASADGQPTPYVDALFTSCSATCVTGLVPFDTALHWSGFGEIVILLLIQLGGLGFMTIVSVFLFVFRRGVGLYERTAMTQSVGGSSLASVRGLVMRIVLGTISCEIVGAGILCIRFIPDFGALRGVYYSIFHAVSAFCNAGFDLMGSQYGANASLSAYASDPLVSLTVCALIIIGGLGFCVWGDVVRSKLRPWKFRFYTKLILLVSAVMLFLSTMLFLLFERNASLAGRGFGERLLCSFFNACTARTAGFSTTDLTTVSDSGYLLFIVLMFVGGCSGSTAGGIKVGTFAVILMGMFAAFRGKKDINIGKRRIEPGLLGQALAIFAAYLMLIITGTIVICAADPAAGVKAALFETVSAIGTVGLSLSLTSTLGVLSKLVLVVLMFAGRVGVLTLAQALGVRKKQSEVRNPVDVVYIG